MEITLTLCDNPGCKKETKDVYNEKGWIILNWVDNGTITITNGRKARGEAKTKFRKLGSHTLTFCCEQCLIKYIGSIE